MVGPGTGIAPFVAFMQEREQSPLAKRNWLFFGECHQASDFYYEDYWRALEARGCLRLDLAFSRDQQHKIYVQHRMQEHAKDLWQWILDGAVIYVCGDAKRMAKDVEATLRSIAQSQGHMSEDEAKSYIKGLRKEKRYLRDVY
jgi:sulfite reductase (NADPH) flavoprotein alpha-component